MDDPRFAIYFVPPADSALYRFGASFLGYDCYTGEGLGPPACLGLSAHDRMELTRTPRLYGFHATLKAPFHLVPTVTESDLVTEFRRFAAAPRTLATFEPVIASLGQFVAIVPAATNAAVDLLAADCVAVFDRFRRPPSLADRCKRLSAGLSPRQVENLDKWGYPFVFQDFRFHMTLTGSIEADRRAALVELLEDCFKANCGDKPLTLMQLALVRQDAPATPFRVVGRVALAPSE